MQPGSAVIGTSDDDGVQGSACGRRGLHPQNWAMPKSMALRCESASSVANRKFSGFTSRMTTPLAWNWLMVRSISRTMRHASADAGYCEQWPGGTARARVPGLPVLQCPAAGGIVWQLCGR